MKYFVFFNLLVFNVIGQSLAKTDSLKKIFQKAQTQLEHSKAAIDIANSYFPQNLDSVKKYLEISFKNAGTDPLANAKAHKLKATLMQDQNDYDGCVKENLIALQLLENTNHKAEIAKVFNSLALTYKKMGDVQKLTSFTLKGKEYALKSIDIFRKINDTTSSFVSSYINLGIILRDLGDFQGAKESFEKGMKIRDKYNIQGRYAGIITADYGQNFIDFGKDYDKAIYYLKKSIEYYKQENYRKGIEHAHRNLAEAYRLKKEYPLSVFHAKTAVEIAKSLKDNHRLFNSYNALFQAQEASGDFRGAFENLKLAKIYEDSTLKVEKLKSIADVETKYQTVKKEAEIGILGEKNKAQQKGLWLLMAGLIVTLGFIWAIYLQNKKLNESRKQISEQADQLKLMMKELHHRVKNNLAIVSGLLRIQSNKLEDESAIQAVRQGQQRVDAMSLIHQRLYQTDKVTTVNIKEYIIDLAESLMNAYGFEPTEFDLNISVEKEEVDVDLAIALGLIINELLTNSFKYAYQNIDKPALTISLKGNKDLNLEIKDNGIGIDLNRWKTAKDSFGKKMIAGLVNQIGGKFSIENDGGTVFRMKIATAAAA